MQTERGGVVDWRSVTAVAAGGALGSVLRYLIGIAALRRFGGAFPVGTFAINVAGSFFIGAVAEAALRPAGVSAGMRTFLAVGVLGGFTTFSSFSLETLALAERGAPTLAFLYAAGSVLLGVAAALAGTLAVRATGF